MLLWKLYRIQRVLKVETNIITGISICLIERAVILVKLLFYQYHLIVFDFTLTDNFKYKSELVDTDEITRRGKMSKLLIKIDSPSVTRGL